MEYSKNLRLNLPGDADPVEISKLSENFQALDALIKDLQDELVVGAKIESGSYVGTGTGTAGDGIWNSLTFGFSPKAVIVVDADGYNSDTTNNTYGGYPWLRGATYAPSVLNYWVRITWMNNAIQWRGTSGNMGVAALNVTAQMNLKDHTYYWVAIG